LPEIIGFIAKRPFAVMMKKECLDLSKRQFEFMKQFEKCGGLVIVAEKLSDIERVIK
jgi:hypothetical protein